MTNLRNFIGLFLVSLLFFTACKKDRITPTAEVTTDNTPSTTTIIDPATQTRAMAAAAMASSRNNEESDTTDNDCGCYDLFDSIDFDASHAEVEAAIETILENLSETEIERLFEPVCTDDGNIYESACIADCEGITNYHVCSEEELADYFFGDFECDDLEDLTFPTEIELPDGSTVTVNSEEELFDLLNQWFETLEEDWENEDYEDCFTVVFPIQVEFPGGNIISYDSEEALYTGVEAWFDLNKDSEEEPVIVYPFEVTLPDGTTTSINNELEEEALWVACFGDIDFDICFDLNYPITLVYPDGSTLVINNDDELEKAEDAFYEANDDTDKELDVQYPINITLEDGTVQEINNIEALEEALEACYEDIDFGRLTSMNQQSMLSTKRVVKGAVLSGK